MKAISAIFLLIPIVGVVAAEAPDRLVADFEASTYGAWQVEGEAFGSGPAQGTLAGQMTVSGFRGDRLVNSFFGGDNATGTLTSPDFTIERNYLTFLIGGGGYPGETCMNLLLDGTVVRTAVGPNVEPGGSEQLHPSFWDVGDLLGKTVSLQIVDARTGGWGHVNVDHIVQSDLRPAIPEPLGLQSKTLVLSQRFLVFPIHTGAGKVRVDLRLEGRTVREFDAELAQAAEEAAFWAFLDVGEFEGQRVTLNLNPAAKETLALIVPSDEVPGAQSWYGEALRPQFHFSQKVGWNNDPNGMVHYDGEWHLYFQHNPYGWDWGNMHWGHAVSRDLVHWEQLPIALYNRRHGDWAFSGGAVVDERNTAGWQTGAEKVIVVSWTSTGRGECVAYSQDRGRTFTEYEGNPVIRHNGRDPKIIWYEPGQHWVLVVYDQPSDTPCLAFYSSSNLKDWTFQSRLPGYFECPELLELPVDGDPDETRWVVFGADAQYALGRFDGKLFTPEHEGKHRVHYGDYYASQVFNNGPDGRRIQIGWARIPMPGMPFNQTFTFPHALELRTTGEGVRMFAEPVKEIERLRGRRYRIGDRPLDDGHEGGIDVEGELFDVRARFEVGSATRVGLDLGGERVVYEARAGQLRGAPLQPVDGQVTLRVLVDRPMLEIIGNQGRVYLTLPREVHGDVSSIRAFAEGGTATLLDLEIFELKSIWQK